MQPDPYALPRTSLHSDPCIRLAQVAIPILGISLLSESAHSEIPVDHWANPVLANAQLVLGPLENAAKLVSKAFTDYSVLIGSVSIVNYRETHVFTRGTFPVQSRQTIVQHHYLDPVDNKTSVWDTYVTFVDNNGKQTSSVVSHDSFPHGVGNAHWKCESTNANGSLIARSELLVDPTRMKVTVDVSKYANTRIAYPGRTMVWLDAPTTALRDCDLGGKSKEWSYQTSVTPSYPTIITFSGANMISDFLPTVQIGYLK